VTNVLTIACQIKPFAGRQKNYG